jgi:hypothetical protein
MGVLVACKKNGLVVIPFPVYYQGSDSMSITTHSVDKDSDSRIAHSLDSSWSRFKLVHPNDE